MAEGRATTTRELLVILMSELQENDDLLLVRREIASQSNHEPTKIYLQHLITSYNNNQP
jgi:hypothetical protein